MISIMRFMTVNIILLIFIKMGSSDSMTMYKIQSSYVTLWSSTGTLVTYYQTQTILMCARRCLGDSTCQAIAYDQSNLTCTLGKCVITQSIPRSSSLDLYQTPQTLCNSTPGFNVDTIGHTLACLYWSDTKKNFTEARKDCKGKGSNLATFNNLEKFQILVQKSPLNQAVYIGLDDIEVEGVFRWNDDGSVLDSSYEIQIFKPGEPNNANNDEDCVAVWNQFLNDYPCSYETYFVCEIVCFN